MTRDDNKFDISLPTYRKKFIDFCEEELSKFYEEHEEAYNKYFKIGEYLSKLSCCCSVISNIYELYELLEIKVRASQLGIDDVIDREEISTIEDLVLYANEIDWTSSKSNYDEITNLIGDMCIYLNEVEDLIQDSEYTRQTQSLENFKDDLIDMLNNLMNTRYDLKTDEIIYINELSKEQKLEFITVYIHEIERIDIKIANIVKEIIEVSLFVNTYL